MHFLLVCIRIKSYHLAAMLQQRHLVAYMRKNIHFAQFQYAIYIWHYVQADESPQNLVLGGTEECWLLCVWGD